MPAPYELVCLEVVMEFCHNCGLSIGEKATFCATCGALVPVAVSAQESVTPRAAPVEAGPQPPAAVTDRPACRLCGRAAAAIDGAGVCPACHDEIARFVAPEPSVSLTVTLATSEAAAGRERLTIVNAIYSALADDGTCPACGAMDGRETTDLTAAAAWAPNPHCSNPAGCRCTVFFEHENLSVAEEDEFVDYAAAHGLHVTAPAIAAFHDEQRRHKEQVDGRLANASLLLREARQLEKSAPQEAVALYRRAVEDLMECGAAPLDESRVRRDLPLAFNRLTLVLKTMRRDAEALDEIDRAASWGILERDDCGRKSDREALRNRSRRLRERHGAVVTA